MGEYRIEERIRDMIGRGERERDLGPKPVPSERLGAAKKGYPPLAPSHRTPARSRQRHHTGVADSITAERQREDARR